MKAVVIEEYGKNLKVMDVETPRLSYGEILVRVRYCGICGTDLKIVSGKLRHIISLPHIPGHEIAGEVVEIGRGVKNIKPGDRGIIYLYLPCRDCELCRTGRENICYSVKRIGFELDGGFAEYVKVPEYNFCRIEDNSELWKMCILPDAVETPYHALRTLLRPGPSEKLLIVGAGGLGLHAIQIAKLMGLFVAVVDVRSEALEAAEKLGADLVVNAGSYNPEKEITKWTDGKGVDFVIEGVGNEKTLSWSLHCLKRGGKLVVMGYDPVNPFSVKPLELHYNEWSIIGARLGTKQELLEVIQMVENGKVAPMIAKIFPLNEINRAIEELKSGLNVGRIVVEVR